MLKALFANSIREYTINVSHASVLTRNGTITIIGSHNLTHINAARVDNL